ncbi:MAG: glycosyltransferase family 4 protein [Methanosarcina sp.]
MSYVIFGDLFTFPEGEAATNRVHTYGKGFVSNGKKVHVICFGNVYTHFINGEINGIKFYHPYGQTKRSRYFAVRSWKKILKFVRTFRLVRNINRDDKIKGIIVYSGLPLTFFFAWFLAGITNSRLIQEISEHPLRYYENGKLRKKIGIIKLKTESAMVDGILCISHFLINFYTDLGFPLHRLMLVPSTVDPQRYNVKLDRPFRFPYIGYFGMLSFQRDNVDLLVEAFARIAPKYPELRLVLGGPEYGSEKTRIIRLAEDLGISPRLKLLDYMPREEILKYIVNSDVLVMVRANDLKSQASFPSKLTEYLATGRPVISVNVGEISEYLADGVHAYIVEPGNKDKLAEKIDYVLTRYDSALETASRGRELVHNVFNYSYQAKRIIPFIDSLYKV